jgi:hypothetical protein
MTPYRWRKKGKLLATSLLIAWTRDLPMPTCWLFRRTDCNRLYRRSLEIVVSALAASLRGMTFNHAIECSYCRRRGRVRNHMDFYRKAYAINIYCVFNIHNKYCHTYLGLKNWQHRSWKPPRLLENLQSYSRLGRWILFSLIPLKQWYSTFFLRVPFLVCTPESCSSTLTVMHSL